MSPLRPGSRPQPAPPYAAIADRLDRIVPDFDALIRDARLGHPLSPRAYDALEERAQAIADALIAAFRGEGARVFPNAPVHAPIARIGTGRLW